MHKLISGVAAGLLCSMFTLANPSIAAAFGRGGGGFGHGGGGGFHGGGGGGFHGFHGGGGFRGFHGGGFRGFYGGGIGLYPYGDYYPYSLYEDDDPDCRFVWVRQAVRHRIVRRGIWTCS